MHLVLLFLIDKSSLRVEKLIDDLVEFPRDSILEISAVQRVLLHLVKDLALENLS